MFDKATYVNRRAKLKELVKSGIIILFGNNESPCNCPANGYSPFRQDSSFLYYFGLNRDGLVGVIDIDNDIETLVGNDIDIEDIVWFGSVDSVHDMAESVGVKNSAPMKSLKTICNDAMRLKRRIHFLPPYRHDIKIQIFDLLGIHPVQQKEAASMDLINAVVKMRSTKEQQEIEELERAAVIGYKMHTTAMRLTKPVLPARMVQWLASLTFSASMARLCTDVHQWQSLRVVDWFCATAEPRLSTTIARTTHVLILSTASLHSVSSTYTALLRLATTTCSM